MDLNIEQLINILLHKSELLEEEIKQKSDLKNLTSKQLYCLELIYEMNNPALSELATGLSITKPSVSVMIDRLEDKKYIYKVKSDKDRRSAHVHLTKNGLEAAKLHTEVHNTFAKSLTKDLTDSEQSILKVLLNKAIRSV